MAKYIFLCGRAPKKPQPLGQRKQFLQKSKSGRAFAQPQHIQFVFCLQAPETLAKEAPQKTALPRFGTYCQRLERLWSMPS